ncbi:MAG: hypothetical protein AAGK78_00570, partial [Planctomycetota bacterium]
KDSAGHLKHVEAVADNHATAMHERVRDAEQEDDHERTDKLTKKRDEAVQHRDAIREHVAEMQREASVDRSVDQPTVAASK